MVAESSASRKKGFFGVAGKLREAEKENIRANSCNSWQKIQTNINKKNDTFAVPV